ncbi:hypothetical protein TI04_00620 [Achromatium sp. WMS2]|nr:hypothetical protein TI04_00620 [Achromatium sp. WMS2]
MLWILALWIGMQFCVLALPKDAASPIDISADSVEINEAQNTSTYIGRVEAQQGSMRLTAERVQVYHLPSRQPALIKATGSPVRYQQQEVNGQEIIAVAQNMEYDLTKQVITLSGNAKLTRNKDNFSSDRIVYERKKGLIRAGNSAKGRQRVHISITPDGNTRMHSTAD